MLLLSLLLFKIGTLVFALLPVGQSSPASLMPFLGPANHAMAQEENNFQCWKFHIRALNKKATVN